jgi:DNA-binding MarR family transcriptional regulator
VAARIDRWEAEPAGANEGVGRLVLRVGREMRTLFERRLADLGITAQQAELLHRVHRQGDVSPNDLTHLLMTDNAGVTRLVDRLEAKGLIARRASPEDGRSVVLELTRAGRALIPRVARQAKAQKRLLFGDLAAADERKLKELLRRVLANALAAGE